MDNSGRLYSQVAAEAGVKPDEAMIACYLLNLSRQGKTICEAGALLRQDRATIRDYSRDWGISFIDYAPAATPLCLSWTKEKRGRWTLELGGVLVAEAESDGEGGYCARKSGETEWTHSGSSAEVAIRRLSIAMERASVQIFGVDDIVISMMDKDGFPERMAPKECPEAVVKQRALAL